MASSSVRSSDSRGKHGTSGSSPKQILFIRGPQLVLALGILCHAIGYTVALGKLGSPASPQQKHPGLAVAHFDVGAKRVHEGTGAKPLSSGLRPLAASQAPSVLNQSLVDNLRQSLGQLALRLERALAVDRNRFDVSSPPASALLEAQIAQTASELARVNQMQATMRELEGLSQTCANHFFSRLPEEFLVIRPLTVSTGSPLVAGHTLSFTFDHLGLISTQLALPSANDIRIYHQPCRSQPPVEVHRIIQGVGTSESTLHFPVLEFLEGDTAHANRYALVFGNPAAGNPLCDPRQVFRYYEDFAEQADFANDWVQQRGTWTVMSGYLDGRVTASDRIATGGAELEVGAFLSNGMGWTDVEVQMDVRVTGGGTPSPSPLFGPFLRLAEPSFARTTAAFVQYTGGQGATELRLSSIQRDTVEETSVRHLPAPYQHNRWHRVRHVVLGKSISQWFDGAPVEPAVSLESMARSGSLGLGVRLGVGQSVCSAMFDNIRVRSVVAREPVLTLPERPCPAENEIKAALGSHPSVAADSCRQIYDLSFQEGVLAAANGAYFVRTPDGPVETFCDMTMGGWTLVGQIGGIVGPISATFLLASRNTDALQSPTIANNIAASLNAVDLAVNHATEILLSRGNRQIGIGDRWVRWALPAGRRTATFWRRAIGAATVNAAPLSQVRVIDWMGRTQDCLQNEFGISPKHGALPATVSNAAGDPSAGDLCMAIGVNPGLAAQDGDGFTLPQSGFDAPTADGDWLNMLTGTDSVTVSIWLK